MAHVQLPLGHLLCLFLLCSLAEGRVCSAGTASSGDTTRMIARSRVARAEAAVEAVEAVELFS